MIFNSGDVISVFSKRPQNMSLNHGPPQDSISNRRDFLEKFGIDSNDLVCAKQIHGSRVECVDKKHKSRGALIFDNAIAETDALITVEPNLPLAILTADCFPVFLYDSLTPAIGIIHAGWRGAKKNIVLKTARLMAERFGTRANKLYAGLGPAIRECCYQVGPEFKDYFTQELIQRNNLYYLDLAGIIKGELMDFGIEPERIFDPRICTSCENDEFFSYRREGVSCGRIMSVIALTKESGAHA